MIANTTGVLATDVRMFHDASASLRATQSAGSYDQWQPYVEIFGSVVVLARVSEAEASDSGPTEGPGVRVHPVANYRGFSELVQRLPRIIAGVWNVPLVGSLPIVKLPEPLSVLLALRCVVTRVPYVAIVVADVETFVVTLIPARSARLSRLVGRLLRRTTAWLVRRAAGVVFVTEEALQRRYPADPAAPVLTRSSVMLEPSSIASPRPFPDGARRLIAVGSQQSRNKGHDTAIEALRLLSEQDRRYQLVLVGDGKVQPELRSQAERAGLADQVRFTGQLSTTAEVRTELDRSDMFLMPSRSEGLPRAIIEAMAAGLPVVGSAVGGIPEMLSADCLVSPDDAPALAARIEGIFSRPDVWTDLSRKNVDRAHRIAESTTTERLEGFLAETVRPRSARGLSSN